MRRLCAVAIACLMLASTPAFAQSSSSNEGADEGWWSPWFIVDYSLILAGATTYIVAGQLGPRRLALFGPQYDPNNPTSVLAPEYSDRIGRPFADDFDGLGLRLGETVPAAELFGIAASVGGLLALQEGALWLWSDKGSAQMFHEVLVGYAEATALTAAATEFSKVFAGRLRPDFQDRAARHLCNTNPPDGLDCTEYVGRPLDPDPVKAQHLFEDGRKSFWSGHSSFSFATFTYASLVTGGRWVWGDGATTTSRSLGLLAQMMFMGTAVFVAASRIDDQRHHLTDVLVGTATGFGLANFSYWRRFGGSGKPLRGKNKPSVVVGPGPGAGLSLTIRN